MEAFEIHPGILIFGWVSWGILTGYLAQQRGRDQWLWGLGGLLFGLIAVIVLFVRPNLAKQSEQVSSTASAPRPPAQPEVDPVVVHRREPKWFYLDADRKQQGPVVRSYLEGLAREGVELTDRTYVWSEGMEDWIRWGELAPRSVAGTSES